MSKDTKVAAAAKDIAVLLQRPKPVVSKKAVREKLEFEKFASGFDCFFEVIACIAPNNADANVPNHLKTATISNAIFTRMMHYTFCFYIFTEISLAVEKNTKIKIDATERKIDEKIIGALSKNLKANYRKYPNPDQLDEKLFEEFFAGFKSHYEVEGQKKTTLGWHQEIPKYHHSFGPMLALYFTSLDVVKKLGLKEDDVVTTIAKRIGAADAKEHPAVYRGANLFTFLRDTVSRAYGFQPAMNSEWNPQSSIDTFISLLSSKGYLIVGGPFGNGSYKQPPKQKKIGALDVFYWGAGSLKEDNNFIQHGVIVVGASRAGYENLTQDMIYFIDPHHDRDQKIYPLYIMSYKSFCQRIGLVQGVTQTAVKNGLVDAKEASYLLVHPQFVPQFQLRVQGDVADTVATADRAATADATGVTVANRPTFWSELARHAPSCETITKAVAATATLAGVAATAAMISRLGK